MRYTSDGIPDSSFGINSKLTTAFDSNDAVIRSINIQTDDSKILAAGSSGGYTFAGQYFSNFALARFSKNGLLDNTFGINGKVTTNIGLLGRNEDCAYSSVLQPDGKIVLAGYSKQGTNKDFALARYNPDGSLDNTFSDDGILTTDFGFGDDIAKSVALLPDGKIVAGGSSFNGMDDDFAFAVYNTDGTLATQYGTGGKVATDIGQDDIANTVLIQPTGEIVLVGSTYNGNDWDFALARYLSELNVGVIDFSAPDNSAVVYPNPIGQNATLEYTLSSEEEISIHLLDMQGKTVNTFVEHVMQQTGRHQQTISLPGGLAAGAYLIVISSPKGKMSVRVVK